MGNEYIESKKIWRGPSHEIDYPNIGVGQAVLEKLKDTDPTRVLEVEHETGASLTAGDIRRQTITVAQNLMRIGVKQGDIAIIFSNSNIKITPITFALYTIGAPINFIYLNLKKDDIKYYFTKFDPTLILYEEEFKNDVLSALEELELSNLKHTLSLDSETSSVDDVLFKPIDDIDSFQPPDIGDPNKLTALFNFTSGSTGMPKIAMQSHAMMLLGVYNKWWNMEPKSVVCTFTDLRWTSQVELMLQPVFFDVKRVYTSKDAKDFDNTYEHEMIDKHKITHLLTVPILYLYSLKNAVKYNKTSKLSHLRTVLFCGEVVTSSLVEYAKTILPNCKLITSYSMTELHGNTASDEEVTTGEMVNGGILANEYSAKIIDEEGNNLGPNEKGLLCIKSKAPIMGYFKNEQANKEQFIDGWFKTEDYAFMDSDCLLNIVIRYKYLLRFNGKFVIPTDVERIISDHPNVLTSSLVGYPDPDNSASDIGTVFVVLRNDSYRDGIQEELITLLKENLSSEQTELVRFLKVLDKMPLCNDCKINRTALKAIAAKEAETYLRI